MFFLPLAVKQLSQEIKIKFYASEDELLNTVRGSMKVGYARVSTQMQNLDLQKHALKEAGCQKIVTDVASGKHDARPGLKQLRDVLRSGDTLVVWRLDRLGRSLTHLLELAGQLEQEGIRFQSLQEAIDTTTPGGKLVFNIFGSLAAFERDLIRERTKAGLEAARARGKRGGRKPALSAIEQEMVVELYRLKKHTVGQICREYGISRPTLYAYVQAANSQE